MKITNELILCLTLLLCLNCSTSSSDDDSTTPDIVTVEKDLLKMSGDADHWLNYENGKINKAWSTSTTFRSQMVYNSDTYKVVKL